MKSVRKEYADWLKSKGEKIYTSDSLIAKMQRELKKARAA
jgi:hypothetical protein